MNGGEKQKKNKANKKVEMWYQQLGSIVLATRKYGTN